MDEVLQILCVSFVRIEFSTSYYFSVPCTFEFPMHKSPVTACLFSDRLPRRQSAHIIKYFKIGFLEKMTPLVMYIPDRIDAAALKS